jgi:hypothetical protein
MAEDKRSEDPALAGFYEDMEKTNTEKKNWRNSCWII